MALCFRKSIKIAPGVKLNLNKNSAGVSFGGKGKHYTVNSKGKATTTVGIPGSGLSYSTTSGGGKTTKASKKSKGTAASKNTTPEKKNGCGGCLTSFLVVFGILFILFMIIPSGDKKEDKNPLGFNVDFNSSYRNDVTGRWRLARIAENKTAEEYALDYYHNYFESDDEVHIIINFTLNTTNRIIVIGNLLDVATMEYVDKEEHDAKIACSGMLLSEYLINIDTGEIEKVQPTLENSDGTEGSGEDVSEINVEQSEQDRIAAEQAEMERIAAEQAEYNRLIAEQNQTDEQVNNFDTYNNAEQQQTANSYVLNTSSMKFHSPSCKDVAKIAPQNYSTYDGSRDEVIGQGYSPCGHCNP